MEDVVVPIDFNENRAEYFPASDLAAAYYLDRAGEVLGKWTVRHVETVNDAIEVHQCKKIAEAYGDHLEGVDSSALVESAGRLFGAACGVVSNLVKNKGILSVFDGVELQYMEHFWEFFAVGNLWSNISSEGFKALLRVFPDQIPYLLGYQQVVNQYDSSLAEAMRVNAFISAESIIGAFAVKGNEDKPFFLPRSLSDADIDHIMLTYLGGITPEVNFSYICILAKWPSSAIDKYRPSPEVRVAARRHAELTEKEMLSESDISVRFGSEILFSLEQKACKKVVYEDGLLKHAFSLEWLQEYTDYATVLNNFLYVFDLVGRDGILNCSSRGRTASTLFKIMGPHFHDEYQVTIGGRVGSVAAFQKVFGYRRLLLKCKTRLEDAIEWFFNDYIKDEFEVEGFSISLPTEGTSWLDKCKAIGPEIERVLRAFKLYAKKGFIDTDYFPYVTVKEFGEIPSLLDGKYLIEGEEFERPATLLLSDQSPLAYSFTHPHERSGFYRLVKRLSLTENDFRDIYYCELKYLIDNGFVEIDEDGMLQLTDRAHLVALVWKRGAARCRDYDGFSGQIEKLVSEKVVAYSSTLFSPDEADYMSYLLNNAKFCDALALRNKYDHGSSSAFGFTEKEMESDYCRMLAALIGIVLKINEELSYVTGRGGFDTCVLVDWPLVEE